jgi:hypothetical protein
MAKLCEDVEMLDFESHTHKIIKKDPSNWPVRGL